jgi:thiol:disulfide interchange protein DsbD
MMLASTHTAEAQSMKDPCQWTYSAKSKSAHEYEICFTLNLDKGWHIWSMHVGGDGSQIVPLFSFNPNKAMQLVGATEEKGQLQSAIIEGIEGKVNYFADQVRYTQIVKAKAGTIIKGTHTYQVCSDMLCLPPKDLNFSITLE